MGVGVWPLILLGTAAWLIALRSVIALSWRAPVDAPALIRSLKGKDRAAALALCEQLRPSWAAECGSQLLRAQIAEDQGLAYLAEELDRDFEQAGQRGLDALRTLGRMALPLSLGSAIITLGAGMQAFEVASAQAALRDALQAVTAGMATLVFCRLSLGSLQRQAAERLDEVRRVANVVLG